VLAVAERPYRGIRCRVARQLEAANAFHGDDQPFAKCASDVVYRVRRPEGPAVRPAEVEPGPARRTGVRLRMKSTVAHVVVLALAGRTHRERSHRRPGPVVRSRADDGESRSAVGAVGERVAVAAIMEIVN